MDYMDPNFCCYKKAVKLNHLLTPPSATYMCMRQWIGLALVQTMVCRLVGAKSLSEPVLECYQLDPKEQT